MLMLPPVNCMPNCGWAYAAFTGAATTRTFVRSTSSSSAMSMGRDVEMPCPISALFTRMVTTEGEQDSAGERGGPQEVATRGPAGHDLTPPGARPAACLIAARMRW